MLTKALLPVLATLAFVAHVCASPQVTTALPFGVSSSDDLDDTSDGEVISGVIVGSGADGTTYVFSVGATGTDDTPFTVTLVENASAASAVVEIHGDSDEGGSFVETELVQCSFSGDAAICEQQLIVDATSTTFSTAFTTSGAAESITVVVSTSLASEASSTNSASDGSQSSGAGKMTVARMTVAGALFCLLFGFAIVPLA